VRRCQASRTAAALLVAAATLTAAGQAIAEPKSRSVSYYYDGVYQTARPVARSLDPALLVRKISGKRREAANVDENDQVRLPSTWWQPRLGFRPVTVEQMLKGPGGHGGPAPGRWKVVKAKTQGVSPGFQIKDSEGTRFAIKFDPPGFPEMATGADVVTSYLYWAAGYNVPENVIVSFRRDDLEIGPGATYEDPVHGKQPITPEFLDRLLARVSRRPDSSFRAVASRFLPGKPLGEWKYSGRRRDDPEDLIPHELRRELRGLWTINSWVHHDDCSARNTLDMWVTEGGRSFVRHHLIDFSGCLGAASIDKHSYRSGTETLLDYGVAARSLVTLGLRPSRWESVVDPDLPSVGFIESKAFDPAGWRPFLPNPAFDERTRGDIRWGARIVAAFTDEHIRAAVMQGRYSDPRAVDYLVKTLVERRDKIAGRWLSAPGPSAKAIR